MKSSRRKILGLIVVTIVFVAVLLNLDNNSPELKLSQTIDISMEDREAFAKKQQAKLEVKKGRALKTCIAYAKKHVDEDIEVESVTLNKVTLVAFKYSRGSWEFTARCHLDGGYVKEFKTLI